MVTDSLDQSGTATRKIEGQAASALFEKESVMNGTDGSGIFDETVDKRAFFDTLVLSVWGERKEPKASLVGKNIPIGGRKRAYAHAQKGKLPSGNPYELKYGLSMAMRYLPTMMLTVRSEESPLTVIDVTTAMQELCENATRVQVSEAELTFDTTGVSVDDYRQLLLSPARTFTQIPSDRTPETIYVGVRQGPWQIRIYTKSPTVTRFEYVLRAEHLRKVEISTPLDLVKVRDLDLNTLSRVRELDEAVLKKSVARLGDLTSRVIQSFRRNLPLQEFLRAAELRFPESAFLKPAIAKRLEKMQRRLLYDPYFPGEPLRTRKSRAAVEPDLAGQFLQ